MQSRYAVLLSKAEEYTMMYPYLTLEDDTEVVHSEWLPDNRVKVYIETPDEKDGFHHATCYLPDYQWEDIFGYSEQEMTFYKELVKNNAHLIIEFSQRKDYKNAAGF